MSPELPAIRLQFATSEQIRAGSSGEVKAAKLVDGRSGKFIKGGLYCEEVFGKEDEQWCCPCERFHSRVNSGRTCSHCGKKLRYVGARNRQMGHIELAGPVIHPWVQKSGLLAALLGMPHLVIRKVLLGERHLVLEAGNSPHAAGTTLTRLQCRKAEQEFDSLRTGQGVSAIAELLKRCDLKERQEELNHSLEEADALIRSLQHILNAERIELSPLADFIHQFFRTSLNDPKYRKQASLRPRLARIRARLAANLSPAQLQRLVPKKLRTELTEFLEEASHWRQDIARDLGLVRGLDSAGRTAASLLLDCLPVISPELRPLKKVWREKRRPRQKQATTERKEEELVMPSALTLRYQRVLETNTELRELLQEEYVPASLIDDTHLRLQLAVESLLDDGCFRAIRIAGSSAKPEGESVYSRMNGKEGTFRRLLLGKRVDYSGRAVIIPGPDLKLHQCGIPVVMARELFRPQLICALAKALDEKSWLSPELSLELATLAVAGTLPRSKWLKSILSGEHVHRQARVFDPHENDQHRLDEGAWFLLQNSFSHNTPTAPATQDAETVCVNNLFSAARELLGIARVGELIEQQLNIPEGRARETARQLLHGNFEKAAIVAGKGKQPERKVKTRLAAISRYLDAILAEELHDRGLPSRAEYENYLHGAEGLIRDILHQCVESHPVLLLRAPTLQRTNLQAFTPVLVEGNSIQLHPLLCQGFDADFDGDSMAVHVPLSNVAKEEALSLLPPVKNLLRQADGRPAVAPSQDVVLGCYYATLQVPGEHPGDGMAFSSPEEVLLALESGAVHRFARVQLRLPETSERIETTPGRVEFNLALPFGLPYQNHTMDKTALEILLADCYRNFGEETTSNLAQALMRFALKMATRSGLSIGKDDFHQPRSKSTKVSGFLSDSLFKKARGRWLPESAAGSESGPLSHGWLEVQKQAEKKLNLALEKQFEKGTLNPLYLMAKSGARGTPGQLRQLCALRGVMANMSGVAGLPIQSCLYAGQNMQEFFVSAHARKSLVEKKLMAGKWGELTRQLTFLLQSTQVTMVDCKTEQGFHSPLVSAIGRVAAETLQRNSVALIQAGEVITPEMTARCGKNIDISIRSPLTCRADRGVCQTCYGTDLTMGRPVALGASVGIVAAQAIGAVGTTLSMQSKHEGGTADAVSLTQTFDSIDDCFRAREKYQQILQGLGPLAAAEQIVCELAANYARGGSIDRRHFELAVAGMLRRVRVVHAGSTALAAGAIVTQMELEQLNKGQAQPAAFEPLLLSLSESVKLGENVLTAAALRDARDVLMTAICQNRRDPLVGSAENIMMGEMAPIGSAWREEKRQSRSQQAAPPLERLAAATARELIAGEQYS